MIEQSLDIGLNWTVFEANEQPLWVKIKQSVTDFLTTHWRSGARQGQGDFRQYWLHQAMTQDDINNGRLIVEIGVAAVKPAEFVIIRVRKTTCKAKA